MKLKLVILSVIITITQSYSMSSDKIKFYIKEYLKKRAKADVDRVDIVSSYKIPDAHGWSVYFLSAKAKVDIDGKKQVATIPQIVFVKGDRITLHLKRKVNRNGKIKSIEYAKILKPKVPDEAYDDEHLILGSKNAPHKIVFFSDPFCPYCRDIVIDIVDVVMKNPKIYGLYYYHLPLVRIHPASEIVARAMLVFQKKGDIMNMLKLYRIFVEPEEKDINKILEAIKLKTGVQLQKEELYTKEISDALKKDLEMKKRLQVTGTPTIFLDGMWDKQRKEFKKYAKDK